MEDTHHLTALRHLLACHHFHETCLLEHPYTTPGEGNSARINFVSSLIRIHRVSYNFSSLQRSVGPYPPTPLGSTWPLKADPSLDAARRESEERERQLREREERERERQRREREEREKQKEREREEKMRKEQQEREQRERERERKEKERRDMERREMERERMIQQQRYNESSKAAAAAAIRDRSPLRNGNEGELIRVKEEPRKPEEDMLMRADPRYHQSMAAAWHMSGGRHPHMMSAAPPHMSRGMMPPSPLLSHFAPPTPGWGSPMDPFRDPYRFDPTMHMRYNPMMLGEVMRAEEAKAINNAYVAAAQAHNAAAFRAKESPGPPQSNSAPPPPQHPQHSQHHRMPSGAPIQKPQQASAPLEHKKEENSQAR